MAILCWLDVNFTSSSRHAIDFTFGGQYKFYVKKIFRPNFFLNLKFFQDPRSAPGMGHMCRHIRASPLKMDRFILRFLILHFSCFSVNIC
jgi:hypothetical protein